MHALVSAHPPTYHTQTPVCTPEGVLFDILNLFPYVQKASGHLLSCMHQIGSIELRLIVLPAYSYFPH